VRIETRWRANETKNNNKAKSPMKENYEQILDTSDLLIENALGASDPPSTDASSMSALPVVPI
jgi:hypothetical protein